VAGAEPDGYISDRFLSTRHVCVLPRQCEHVMNYTSLKLTASIVSTIVLTPTIHAFYFQQARSLRVPRGSHASVAEGSSNPKECLSENARKTLV